MAETLQPSPGTISAIPSLAAPALVVSAREAVLREANGEARHLARPVAAASAREVLPLVCHGPAVFARLGVEGFPVRDLLELFAFVRPAKFCLPTPRGLAAALDLPQPSNGEDEASALCSSAAVLLDELADLRRDPAVLALARLMRRGGWSWSEDISRALDLGEAQTPSGGLDIWRNLPQWEESGPESPPGTQPVDPGEARHRLADLLGTNSEARPSQSDYASAVAAAFQPRIEEGAPNVVLAEAGTGVGKTMGYIAPASLWAERNAGPVWISTFTRNLQRQIDAELDRLYPDADTKRRKVVIRKGRENYLCLLNFEEAAGRVSVNRESAIPLGLLARWALASRDGDIMGGDLPAWLSDLIGRGRVQRLADQRGECIYSGCAHYSRCFVERTVRRARRADIVVANHALVMAHAAMNGLDDDSRITRFIFDEGHHVFDAADSAFAAHLTGQETSDLRRWLLGSEGRRGSRARGLERRVGDLASDDEACQRPLRDVLTIARQLPTTFWQQRLVDGTALGPAEVFLALVRQQVLARAGGGETDFGHGLECEPMPLNPGLADAARELANMLETLVRPLVELRAALTAKLDAEASELDTATRNRIEAVCRSLHHRGELQARAWRDMLRDLIAPKPAIPADNDDTPFVDWFALERIEGREVDVGFYRHWRDPTLPFSRAVMAPSHGVVITSASLRDTSEDELRDWRTAEDRLGTPHLPRPALRAAVPSPFDYPNHTRVFIVTDVKREATDQVAAAYRELFLASGGGGLGLFTAIRRLRDVQRRIAQPLEEAGIPLYAQHVDGMDTATLVDIFRAEENSCLLGTDAVRDGVDVPGRSLRLIVFDRVPWPRPDILHKARKQHFRRAKIEGEAVRGANAYDDMLTRFRLKQAFGRLVRRADDHGVFVLLDSRTPTRLLTAFPPGVTVERVGLAQAVGGVREFLKSYDKKR
ncbi:MAG: ATP-dependent DNA helicase [Rhodospirillales bacterium]